ncbi:ribonuclease H-like domain-containing protein [Tanacetum coccineum]
MNQDSAHMVAASKVPLLKPGEYEIWRMRIEQYIQMIDYALWELKFNSIKDDKKLLEAVKKRFGGNAATRKTQRNLLKQQYENFTALSSEMLDQTFDRLQKLRNKADLDTMSMDDLYNNLKVYEPEVKGMSSSINAANFTNIDNGNETIGFDKSKVECYNCNKRGHFAKECRALRNQDNRNKESSRRSVPMEISTFIALVSCDGLGGYDWSDQAEEGPNYAIMAFSSSNSDSEVSDDEEEDVSQPKVEKKIVRPSIVKKELSDIGGKH